jgi:pyroglutamyl-peptidase
MMNFLITGFAKFHNHQINPSEELVRSLENEVVGGTNLSTCILPVDHLQAPKKLLAHYQQCQPDVVLLFGLAAGRRKVSLERVAINLLDFNIPDNSGSLLKDQPIIPDGPAAYFTTLPVRQILTTLSESNIPAEISLSAGSFICNQVFYTIMHEISIGQKPVKAGFIHLPALPEISTLATNEKTSIPLDQMVQAARIIINQLN